MTIQGTVNKSAFLLMLLVTTAALTWQIAMSASDVVSPSGHVIPNVEVITPMLIGGAIIGTYCGARFLLQQNVCHHSPSLCSG